MYKIAGEERFLLWAVCSIQLQVLPSSVLYICVQAVFFSSDYGAVRKHKTNTIKPKANSKLKIKIELMHPQDFSMLCL